MTDRMPTHTRTPVRQIRLPGQAATPEGPVDMTMMYLMHHAFRRDLAAFAAAVPATPVDRCATWHALARRWELFAEALHGHHEGEDEHIWPALLERATPAARETLEAMEAEHSEIDPILEACRSGFARLSQAPDADARAALSVRLVAAKESLARHLAHEETEAITLIQSCMTHAEWEELDARLRATLTLGKLVRLVPWALHQVPAPVLERILAMPGGTAHRAMWWLTRTRFERLERQAFRYQPAA
jgi:type IV secretory pathway VirJ component